MPSLQDIITAAFGGQTPATQAAQQQFQQRDLSQDKSGQIMPPAGLVPNILTALQALHPDQPHYMDGQQVQTGMAVPWGGKPEKFTPEELNQRINERNLVYHNTYPDAAENIIKQERIGQPAFQPNATWRDVSVSRVPAIPSFRRGVTFAIDPTKMPPSTPLAESGFTKTHGGWSGGASDPNPDFEFENRTNDAPIPLSAIKRVIVNRDQAAGDHVYNILNKALAGKTIGLDVVNTPTLKADRATLLDTDIRNKLLASKAGKWKEGSIKDSIAKVQEGVGDNPPWNDAIMKSISKVKELQSTTPSGADKANANNPYWVNAKGEASDPYVKATMDKVSSDPVMEPMKNPEYIKGVLRNHGLETTTRGGKLFVKDYYMNPAGDGETRLVDTTGWSHSKLKKFLGY